MAIYRLESAEELLIPPTHQFGALRGGDGACWDVLPVIEVLAGCPAEGVAENPVVELVETTGAGAAAQA